MSDDRTSPRPPRPHDMGGQPAGPVDPKDEHPLEPWEKTVDAIVQLLARQGVMTVDELRRGIEDLGPGAYDELDYYERWIASVTANLLEKGVISVEELGRRMDAVRVEWEAR